MLKILFISLILIAGACCDCGRKSQNEQSEKSFYKFALETFGTGFETDENESGTHALCTKIEKRTPQNPQPYASWLVYEFATGQVSIQQMRIRADEISWENDSVVVVREIPGQIGEDRNLTKYYNAKTGNQIIRKENEN